MANLKLAVGTFIFGLLVTMSIPIQAAQQSSVSQWGITWHFDGPYEVGQFANGDWWVVGPVTLTRIEPDYQLFDYWEYTAAQTKGVVLKRIHGWQVNPSPIGNQGFDENIETFDAALVPEPLKSDPARAGWTYTAQPGESIVKAMSGTDPTIADKRYTSAGGVTGKNRLETAAVLTVLASVPENRGATLFRPPYVGSDKPVYRTTDLQTHLLPSLPPVENTPTLDWLEESFERVQLDHFMGTGSGVPGAFLRPRFNMTSTYQPYNASRNGEGALRLMLNDPIEEKMRGLIVYVQYGIDLYHFILNGQRWGDGFGVQPGSKLPLTFAAVMLDHPGMKETTKNSTFFTEHTFLIAGKEDIGVWGGRTTESTYWNWIIKGVGSNFEYGDPYGYIDGGMNGGRWSGPYQSCCISQPMKGSALAGFLVEEMQPVWNQDYFFTYVDRWVNHGILSQPDKCAPAEGTWSGGPKNGQRCTTAEDVPDDEPVCVIDGSKLGITYGPTPDSGGNCYLNGSCRCIEDTDPSDGIGRFPTRDGSRPDGGLYRSKFVDALWPVVRPLIPVKAPVISPDGGTHVGKVDVTIKSGTYGVDIRYTTDGSEPNETAPIYTGPLRLTSNTTIRARSFHLTYEPSVTTAEAVFTVLSDDTPPVIEKITTVDVPTAIWVRFNEALSKESVEDPSHYLIDQGISMTRAELGSDEQTVLLTTLPMVKDQGYLLRVSGITDLFGNEVDSNGQHPFVYRDFDPDKSLHGFWNFNNDPADKALDYSPNQYHASVLGGTWVEGKFEKGFSFDNGDRIHVGDGNNDFGIDPTNEFTLAFWIRVKGHTNAKDEIFGRTDRPISVYVHSDGKISSTIWSGGTRISDAVISDNDWTHIALTYGAGGRTLYINGVRDASGSADTESVNLYWPNTHHLYMGNSYVGLLDEVRIYNKELSADQIQFLMNYFDIPGEVPVVPPDQETDTEAPTTPTNPTGEAVSSNQIKLSWGAATDNRGVVAYEIYRNNSVNPIGFSNGLSYTDLNLHPLSTYSYQVLARDGAGNKSDKSAPVSITTPDGPPPPEEIPASNEGFQKMDTVFNPGQGEFLTVRIQLEKSRIIRLTVYDRAGNEVDRLIKGQREPGTHEFTWKGQNKDSSLVAAGIYLLVLEMDGESSMKKIAVVK